MTLLELAVDEHIILRQFSTNDVDAIFSLIDRNREHLSQYGDATAIKYPTKESVLESIVNPRNPGKIRLGIWDCETFVGSINLNSDNELHAEIGYYLGAEFQGKGYVSKAVRRMVKYCFETLHLKEIWAKTHKENISSQKVLERNGFNISERNNDENVYFFLEDS